MLSDPGENIYCLRICPFIRRDLSLAYHIFTIPHIIIFGSGCCNLFLPVSNAYQLAAYLLIIASLAAACGLCVSAVLDAKDHWVSLFGAVVFGFSGYTVGRSQPRSGRDISCSFFSIERCIFSTVPFSKNAGATSLSAYQSPWLDLHSLQLVCIFIGLPY